MLAGPFLIVGIFWLGWTGSEWTLLRRLDLRDLLEANCRFFRLSEHPLGGSGSRDHLHRHVVHLGVHLVLDVPRRSLLDGAFLPVAHARKGY